MFLKGMRISISKKLTIIYTTILLVILVFFTFLTFYSISNYVLKENESILDSNAEIITNYLSTFKKIDTLSLDTINLSPGVSFNITDVNKNLIYSNRKMKPIKEKHAQDKKRERKDNPFEHSDGIVYTNRTINLEGHIYYIQIIKDFDDIGSNKGALAEILIVTIFFGTLVSFLSGSFLSKKLLKPIQEVTATAKEITSKNLDKRIVTNGADDELKDLADTFNLMIERLETDFEKQRRFVSDASHELRTPLAIIHGHVNLLSRWGKNDPEQLNKSLVSLKSETDNMNKLIENLLVLAKGDNNIFAINRETFSLPSFLKEIVDETLLNHNDFSISYNCEDNLKINGDYNLLKQLMRILIDNSIKYSPVPGDIKIEACKKNNDIFVSVADKGVGIPEESLSHIFDRFYRVDESRTRTTGGTGLGLSIAKQIVDTHKGKIFAESKLNEGSKFTFVIPL